MHVIPQSQEPRFSFGTGNRVGRAKMYSPGPMNKDMEGRDSPGPNTRVRRDGFGKTIVDGGTPVYSFGGKGVERNPVETPANIHGPASVGATAMFGKQSSSKNKTAARAKIGTATRGGASKVYAPGSLNSGFGSSECTSQYPVLSAQCPMPSTQYPMSCTQCPVPNAQYPVPSSQYPVPNAQCPGPSAQYPVPSAPST